MDRVTKPKTHRGKQFLEERAPKLVENPKKVMFIRGNKTSEIVVRTMTDLYMLKKPLAIMYRRKNMTRPFEDATSIEFFSLKSDSSLFVFGCHTKKRPHNLILGRLFDYHILDMIEVGVVNFKSLITYKKEKCVAGSKPCLIFTGDLFETDENYRRLKNFLIDLFRGEVVTEIRMAGLDHALLFTAVEGKVHLRSYRVLLKKSGHSTPRVELDEIGPSLDLVMRRTHLASSDLYKEACKVPKATKPHKEKNVSRDVFGTKHGRIHMQRQDFSKLQVRKSKALKRSAKSTGGHQRTKKPKLDSTD
ncbi:ribosome production factor 2 homolog [Dysidea avara]|uniref:ribosome production factor 2 homolog n=1 Tax=Dysidea avara TaxID=196820 RepID=UPI0033168F20